MVYNALKSNPAGQLMCIVGPPGTKKIYQKIRDTQMPITKDFIQTSGSATVKQILQIYSDRDGQWWWLLVAEVEDKHYVCSFGSLLPYLAGKTPHIVHQIGECAICTGIDPIFWTETNLLLKSVMEDKKMGRLQVSDLPMVELPVIDNPSEESDIAETMMMQKANACGVRTDGVLRGVYIVQVKGNLGEPPQF